MFLPMCFYRLCTEQKYQRCGRKPYKKRLVCFALLTRKIPQTFAVVLGIYEASWKVVTKWLINPLSSNSLHVSFHFPLGLLTFHLVFPQFLLAFPMFPLVFLFICCLVCLGLTYWKLIFKFILSRLTDL